MLQQQPEASKLVPNAQVPVVQTDAKTHPQLQTDDKWNHEDKEVPLGSMSEKSGRDPGNMQHANGCDIIVFSLWGRLWRKKKNWIRITFAI